MNKRIIDLDEITRPNDDAYSLVYDSGTSKKMTFASMADKLWEQMYVNAKKVIVVCSHCGAGNAMTNPVCCKCEAPLGEDAKK